MKVKGQKGCANPPEGLKHRGVAARDGKFRDVLAGSRPTRQPGFPEQAKSPLLQRPSSDLRWGSTLDPEVGRQDDQQQAEVGATFAADGSLNDRAVSEQIQVAPVAAAVERIPTTDAAPAQPRRGTIEELMNQLVEKVMASDEAHRRKTVVLHLDVGDNGKVVVRLQRQGSGFDLRLRPTDPSFADRLESAQGDLRREGGKRGLRFTRIDVVR